MEQKVNNKVKDYIEALIKEKIEIENQYGAELSEEDMGWLCEVNNKRISLSTELQYKLSELSKIAELSGWKDYIITIEHYGEYLILTPIENN